MEQWLKRQLLGETRNIQNGALMSLYPRNNPNGLSWQWALLSAVTNVHVIAIST
jgi:hypothetical protein